MKIVNLSQATMDACVQEAQHEAVVIMRDGKPIALVVGVEGLDTEQLQLGSSDQFWRLITERRGQKAISRVELERTLDKATHS